MALVNPTQVDPNTEANASDVNTPINQLAAQINGNIEAVNLAAGAVTTEKLADGAVTSSKFAYKVPKTLSGVTAIASITAGGSATITLSFPAGFFTQTPIVMLTPSNGRVSLSIDEALVSATQVKVNAFNWSGGNAGASNVYWVAFEKVS